ncbi:MAG: N-formylglutamate amidohydrolase [Rhizobiales bacterium]|nr:N-formylglutamate amidohydrolase [Hyphomicrobiales bacterium]
MAEVSEGAKNHSVVDLINPDASGFVVLVCEHASNFIPEKYQNLGLDRAALQSHIAWDPGALALSKILSRRLNAPLVAQKISRLVYDCNRPGDAVSAIPARSEVWDIPGNAELSDIDRQARIDGVYAPFSNALDRLLQSRMDAGIPTNIVTVHSFTSVFNNKPRDVDVGILHDEDTRMADALLQECSGESAYRVRRNQPYGPEDGVTHTLREHALSRGLPNVMLEIRNDLVGDQTAQTRMADWLVPRINAALDTVSGAQENFPLIREMTGGHH